MPGRRPVKSKSSKPKREGRRFVAKRKRCPLCVGHIETIGYKEPAMLRRYISDRGKIEPRRRTGVCAKHQRSLAESIKRARHLALLPFTPTHIRLSGGVGLREQTSR